MEWQLKIKLVAMIDGANSFQDRKELRFFILSNIKDFDIQSLGIVVRANNLTSENLCEDFEFAKKLKTALKKADINEFSGVEKKKIKEFLQKVDLLGVME